jgi:hypothetical protein
MLTHLKNHLIEVFHLPDVKDYTIWRMIEVSFFNNRKEKVNVKSNIR